ncbi:HET-domain-containing protein, partial [Thozetella sp. PMI_491]
MRLLSARTGVLTEFIGRCPPYAILSHRWGAEEIALQDLTGINQCLQRGGYRKIKECCSQAIQDGLEWVWVDTCCIDKTNSAELTEAINSMFRWYQESQVCYAYLSDVEDRENPRAKGCSFRTSAWFRRGWTLQELVAPSRVIFFTKSWLALGERIDLSTLLEEVTRIPSEYLTGRNIREASVAQKMSWAAERETTRPEDAAYSLLGIFGVNMPLLYGEGTDAFRRLQGEIINRSEDQSLFAWGF